MKEFDPDSHFVKVRGMGSVHYEQDGYKFNSGHKCIGKIDEKPKPKQEEKPKEDVRESARRKIAKKAGKKKASRKKKDDPLDGFREDENPDALSSALREDAAAKAAEEHA